MSKRLVPEYNPQDDVYKIVLEEGEGRSRKQEAGSRKQEAGSRKQEAGSRKQH